MLMTPEFCNNWYALSRLNAVSNLVDPRTSAFGIKEYLEEADSNLLINTDIFTLKILKAIKDMPINVLNYSLNESATSLTFPLNVVSSIIGTVSKIATKRDIRFNAEGKHEFGDSIDEYLKDQPLSIVHTGGTTGEPKGVVLSHDNYNAMAYQYMKSGIGFSPNDGFLLIMPPWISYGSGMLHMSMITGMKSIIIPKLESKKMADYLLRYQPQWFAGVPAHYRIISENKKIEKEKIPFLKAGAV